MIKVEYNASHFWINPTLKANLDGMIYDIDKDWDFVIIITGDGMVRVGKSVLAQQVGAYFASKTGRAFTVDNIVFSGEELMKKGTKVPKQIFVYDEARADLDSKKTLSRVSKVLQDFFAECGMMNHIVILVLPDFFELNKRIAIARSEALINVFIKKDIKQTKNGDVLSRTRGYYGYYGSKKKKKLYLIGKKQNDNYECVPWDFWGNFTNNWVLDKDEYDKKKLEYLRRDRMQEKMSRRAVTHTGQRDCAFWYLHTQEKMTHKMVSQVMTKYGFPLTPERICQAVKDFEEKRLNNKQ